MLEITVRLIVNNIPNFTKNKVYRVFREIGKWYEILDDNMHPRYIPKECFVTHEIGLSEFLIQSDWDFFDYFWDEE